LYEAEHFLFFILNQFKYYFSSSSSTKKL